MNRQDLVDMLIRATNALGGTIPSPPANAASVAIGNAPVPVDPPNNPFLRYTLPEGRQLKKDHQKADKDANDNNAHSASNNANRTIGGGGASGGQDLNWNTNNNDNSNNATGNASGWNAGGNAPSASINWQKSWDGAGERNIDAVNDNTINMDMDNKHSAQQVQNGRPHHTTANPAFHSAFSADPDEADNGWKAAADGGPTTSSWLSSPSVQNVPTFPSAW